MKPAWSLQQPALIKQSCWGRYAQQHCCHETVGHRCWTETVSAAHPEFQSAAMRENKMTSHSGFTVTYHSPSPPTLYLEDHVA